jgi:hypothetical protein
VEELEISVRWTVPTTRSSSQPRRFSFDVPAEQPAVVDDQLGDVGRGLATVEAVPEVEQDPHVVQADLLDAEQGARRRVPGHLDRRSRDGGRTGPQFLINSVDLGR